ncbi:MAG: redox-sensing transcriptional repressor Rex [Verrucomicrobiota bacterium]|nr:redox-sensing transcriptional repressor Rex [Verrucomicrobiota bacterium]
MKREDPVPQKELIHRLVRYKNILTKFKALGLSRVFSDNLGDADGISAALVRKDLSQARITLGNKRGGYPVEGLLNAIDAILGAQLKQRVVIVGCGKIGTALMNYSGFATDQVQILAGFDNHPERINPGAAPVPILPLSQLADFVKEHDVQVAVLAVPEEAAADVLDRLAAAGIRGVLNFTPVSFKANPILFVQNINIAFEMENLFYYVRFAQQRVAEPKNGALPS